MANSVLALEAKCDALAIRDHVHMLGFRQIEDLPAYYGMAKAFIHASTIEPWGLVVNEAMACGLPVLVSESLRLRAGVGA